MRQEVDQLKNGGVPAAGAGAGDSAEANDMRRKLDALIPVDEEEPAAAAASTTPPDTPAPAPWQRRLSIHTTTITAALTCLLYRSPPIKITYFPPSSLLS